MEKDFWKSKKLWAAVLAPVFSALAAWLGPKVGMDPIAVYGIIAAVLVPFGLYIKAQGEVDAKVRSATILAAEVKKK